MQERAQAKRRFHYSHSQKIDPTSCILLGYYRLSRHYSLAHYSRLVTWKRLTKSLPCGTTKLLYRPRAESLIWFTIDSDFISFSLSLSLLLSSSLFLRAKDKLYRHHLFYRRCRSASHTKFAANIPALPLDANYSRKRRIFHEFAKTMINV